jgi:NAD/NADP transhydrogenase beta subunit
MGMLYGIVGMCLLMAAYWADVTYTYDDGLWLVAVSMAPGAVLGIWSSYAVDMTGYVFLSCYTWFNLLLTIN